MERQLEPEEVMDDPAQVRAYAEADFEEVNQGFADRFRALFPELTRGRVLDLGCGPADIPRRLALALPELELVAVDAAPNMLALGREALAAAGVADRVRLVEGRLPGLDLEPGSFQAVISNSLLHHLPHPEVLWSELRRLAAPGAAVLVMDLFRPADEEAARRIVEEADCSDDPLLERDFYHSLLAAFRPDEVRRQLETAGLQQLELAVTSERHLQVWGRLL